MESRSSQRIWIPHPYVPIFDGQKQYRRHYGRKRYGEQKKYLPNDGYDAWHSLRYAAAAATRGLRHPDDSYLAARVSIFDFRQPRLIDNAKWLYLVFKGILWDEPPNLVSYECRWVCIPKWFWRARGIEVIFMTAGEQLRLTRSSRWGREYLYDHYDIGGDS